jgi:RNA polymerase sigma factor (sigma-70 family)
MPSPASTPHLDARAMSALEPQLKALHADALRWATACAHGDADEGADLLQEAYLRLLDGRATFEGRSTLKTWLFGLIRGLALNHHRALRRRLRLLTRRAFELARALHSEGEGGGERGGATPLSRLLEGEARAQWEVTLDAALAALPSRQREVIELVLGHALTVEEAAGVMGVGVGSARAHYARAKARLALLLGAAPEPLSPHSQDGYADV